MSKINENFNHSMTRIIELIKAAPINRGAKEILLADLAKLPMDNVVEVTGCKGCPLHTTLPIADYQWCAYPNNPYASAQMWVNMFDTCPLKQKSITIKIKDDATTIDTTQKMVRPHKVRRKDRRISGDKTILGYKVF